MKFIDALTQARWHLRSLWLVLLLLVLINVLTLLGWMHSASHLKILLPPKIPASGVTLTQGEIPKTTIYAFAVYVWQRLNYWPHNGMKAYRYQIEHSAPLLTPIFKGKLIEDYNRLLNAGELQDRMRFVQTLSRPENVTHWVTKESDGSWVVHLRLHLIEMLGVPAKTVKDLLIDYPLRVVTYNINAKKNPWGLALAGFSSAPQRLQISH